MPKLIPEKVWYEYCRLENDFINYLQYVPFKEGSYHKLVSSPLLVDLLIKICTKIDSFWKIALFYKEFDNNAFIIQSTLKDARSNINKANIAKMFDIFYKYYRYNEQIIYTIFQGNFIPSKPFEDWKEIIDNDGETIKKSPLWWKSYNEVKHNNYLNEEKATIENVHSALMGLFLISVMHKEMYAYLIDQRVIISCLGKEALLDALLKGMPDNATLAGATSIGWAIIAKSKLFGYNFHTIYSNQPHNEERYLRRSFLPLSRLDVTI